MTCKLEAIIADLKTLKQEVSGLLEYCEKARPAPKIKLTAYMYTLANGRKKYTQDYQVALRYSCDQVIISLYAGADLDALHGK